MKSLLSVTTNPAGARVTLRRRGAEVASGPAPFAHTLEGGDYRIVVEHPDFRTVQENVRVGPGKVYVVIVEMSQGHFLGHLRVVTDVPGARVFVDNRSEGAVGETPYSNVITTGRHTVWVDRPGYRLEERHIDVEMGEDETLRVELTRVDHGRIRVTCNVRGATVLVDDRRVGEVPWEGDVDGGPRRVRVEAEDMKPFVQVVDVRPGQLHPMRVRLRPEVSRSGGWVTGTFAVLLITGGAIVGTLSSNLADDLAADRDAGRLAADDARIDEGRILSIAADSAFALGGVLGLLSLYYFLRDPNPESEGRVLEPRDWALLPRLDRDGAGATARWSF